MLLIAADCELTVAKQVTAATTKPQRENSELREENYQLKQALDELERTAKPAVDSSTDSELQRKLDETIQQLSETRQLLACAQDELTVVKQVTAATQRRQLVPADSVYEQFRFDPTQEHVRAKLQPTTYTGCMFLFSISLATLMY